MKFMYIYIFFGMPHLDFIFQIVSDNNGMVKKCSLPQLSDSKDFAKGEWPRHACLVHWVNIYASLFAQELETTKTFTCKRQNHKLVTKSISSLKHYIRCYQTSKQSVFFSTSAKKSVKRGVRVLRARSARASLTRPQRLSPVSLSVFSLVSDLLFDCSRLLEHAKIRTVLHSKMLQTAKMKFEKLLG